MRTPGEGRSSLRLADEEWQTLQNTDVQHGASVDGTEAWYMSAFSWAYVCMAQWNRSVEAAKAAQQPLFLYAAKDYITNVDNRDVLAVRGRLIKMPNIDNGAPAGSASRVPDDARPLYPHRLPAASPC